MQGLSDSIWPTYRAVQRKGFKLFDKNVRINLILGEGTLLSEKCELPSEVLSLSLPNPRHVFAVHQVAWETPVPLPNVS